jgi:TonB system transport protein ExbD (group 1)
MGARLSSSADADDLELTHDINVTPFIDVILVLLIIFMVAAPLSTVDVAVDLPASSAKPAPRPDKPVFVTLKQDDTLALGDDTVARAGLGAALRQATDGDTDKRIFVRADKAVSYGDVMDLMNALREAGFLKIGLVGLDAGKHDDPASPPPSGGTGAKP